MDELYDQATAPPEPADVQPENVISRRRMLKMLIAAGGAAVAGLALPEVWNPPTVEACPLPPPKAPVISNPSFDSAGSAHFNYWDPERGISKKTTLLGCAGTSSAMHFNTLASYGARLIGSERMGEIVVPNQQTVCSTNQSLVAQLRVGGANFWDKKNKYRESNVLAWSSCN